MNKVSAPFSYLHRMGKDKHLHATQEAGKAFFMRQIKGPIVMLNLLKFREIADYSASPELAPSSDISGRQAYQLYIEATMPFLEEAGSKVLFSGKGGSHLIGPQDEDWDLVLLVEHVSTARFLEFAKNQDYLKIAGHRTAALEDSRLLPIEQNG